METDLENILKSFVYDFSSNAWSKLQASGIDGIGITGSYARGDYSKSRPDVNFAIFTKNLDAQLCISIGEIASSLNQKYSQSVNLRPELHPERFISPWGRDATKPDIFFKIAVFQLKDRDLPMPFGRPGFVTEGHILSLKLLYGHDYFKGLKVTSSNEEVVRAMNFTFGQWSRQIMLAPLSYNLNDDIELFFNEALVWGKLAIQQYTWVQGLLNGMDYSKKTDRMKIFAVVHKKENLRTFLKLNKSDMEKVNLILDARLNYNEWKNDKKKAIEIFKVSDDLLKRFYLKVQQIHLPEMK